MGVMGIDNHIPCESNLQKTWTKLAQRAKETMYPPGGTQITLQRCYQMKDQNLSGLPCNILLTNWNLKFLSLSLTTTSLKDTVQAFKRTNVNLLKKPIVFSVSFNVWGGEFLFPSTPTQQVASRPSMSSSCSPVAWQGSPNRRQWNVYP